MLFIANIHWIRRYKYIESKRIEKAICKQKLQKSWSGYKNIRQNRYQNKNCC